MSPDVFERCKETCKKELRSKIDYSREVSDEEIYEMIDELVIREGKKSALSVLEREQLGKELACSGGVSVFCYGRLQD